MVTIFGPIPSRRLGWSLGINPFSEKICTYSCRYCQIGITHRYDTTRRPYADPAAIAEAVAEKAAVIRERGGTIDVVSFVPDGEPTLDVNLGKEIVAVQALGFPVAVITNGSLMGSADVRADLMQADIVSIKIDSVLEEVWHRINAPHPSLDYTSILRGITLFSQTFKGKLLTETMLVGGMNDTDTSLTATAQFIAGLSPHRAYILVPTRPPADLTITPPVPERLAAAWHIYSGTIGASHVEMLTSYEGNAFSATGDARTDILAITAVHPLRAENIEQILAAAGASWDVVEVLKAEGLLNEVLFEGNRFFVRTIHHHTTGRRK